ncbi:winged helix-turn-helix domain-containing protein [Myceligenerans indicum]|uniref:Helix-turn-helix transcriptional regulator n=1 Tax=Myceligenerans indicum TaxID=2593663 RepID=A0ABS1LGY7_9MICO|nr:helix-turn-helix domain-containing protein [Myceligenerans indicum]MBL0885494.1 helix-turn-helix transcriptional regulator [Myceligenerans indicum]
MPRRAKRYRGLAQASRLKVLDIVMARPGIGFAELADLTGLHQNTLRDHVRVLESTGLLRSRSEHRGTRGRPRTVLTAVRGDEPDEAADQSVLDAMRYGDLHRRLLSGEHDVGSEADTAELHQLDALYWHLDGLGLQPELDEAELTAHLVPCPFDSPASGVRETACRVHETLVRDVLVRAGGPLELDSVMPYVTPQECRVQLRRRCDVSSPGTARE